MCDVMCAGMMSHVMCVCACMMYDAKRDVVYVCAMYDVTRDVICAGMMSHVMSYVQVWATGIALLLSVAHRSFLPQKC